MDAADPVGRIPDDRDGSDLRDPHVERDLYVWFGGARHRIVKLNGTDFIFDRPVTMGGRFADSGGRRHELAHPNTDSLPDGLAYQYARDLSESGQGLLDAYANAPSIPSPYVDPCSDMLGGGNGRVPGHGIIGTDERPSSFVSAHAWWIIAVISLAIVAGAMIL